MSRSTSSDQDWLSSSSKERKLFPPLLLSPSMEEKYCINEGNSSCSESSLTAVIVASDGSNAEALPVLLKLDDEAGMVPEARGGGAYSPLLFDDS